MKKLKWWQWSLIAVFGITAIGAIVDPKQGANSPAVAAIAQPTFRAISGNDVIAMVFDPAAPTSTLPDIAREHCGSRAICIDL